MHVSKELTATQIADREPWDTVIEETKLTLAAAYALAGQSDDAHAMLASAMSSQRLMDYTVRSFLRSIPVFYDAHRQEQERRIAEGLRQAGLRDHLDEQANFQIAATEDLRDAVDGPTPVSVPGGTTILTDAMQRLLESTPKPLVLTTTPANPTIPGAIQVSSSNSGKLDDEWQTTVGALAAQATNGDKERPIVAFSFSINHWQSRNLVLRLIALGYKKVYWYRGGWEAWDSPRSSEGSTHCAIPSPELTKIGYMNDAAAFTETAPAKTEHFDVLIVGAGISGIGGAYHLTKQCPGTQLRGAGIAGDLRRHLAHPSLSGHPLRQRPAHLRLSLQAMDGRADRDGRRDPELHGRGDRRERPRPAHPLSAPDHLGKLVQRRTTSGPSRRPAPTPARRCASPRTSCGCARAITGIPRATRRTGTAWSPSRARSCIRRPGRRTSTTGARRSW